MPASIVVPATHFKGQAAYHRRVPLIAFAFHLINAGQGDYPLSMW